MKYCISCQENLPITSFTKLKSSKDGLSYYCGKCCSEKQMQFRRKRGAKPFQYGIGRHGNLLKLRKDVFSLYGSKCSCCGETQFEFLTLDHINGGGNQHRKKQTYQQLFYEIRKIGKPNPKYRILCYNCNCAIAYHKICPHQKLNSFE